MKTVEEILKLTRAEQNKALEELKTNEAVKAFANQLLSEAERAGITGNGLLFLKQGQVSISAITQALRLFPEVADERLAIDRGVDDFGSHDLFVKAVAKDINDGWMSPMRYPELLHINNSEERYGIAGMQSGTLLAFILPHIDKPDNFLDRIKKYNPKLFENYIKTVNQFVTATGTLETKPLFELYDAYRRELGLSEENWKQVKECIAPAGARNANNQAMRVNTHNTASHKSADESHVKAFEIFAKSLNQAGQITFSEQDNGRYRKVSVQNNNALNNAVKNKNNELKSVLDRLLKSDAGRNARIYNEYYKYTLTKDDIGTNYENLSAAKKEEIDPKIKGFIFKAEAAQRYVNDMLTKHRIDGGYAYNTTDAATCGLNMEQMIAACYFATTDSANFRSNDENQKESAFVALVDQLYDMRRGYDIDGEVDNPDKNIFPEKPGADRNRCYGGGVNSLAGALPSIHSAYNIKAITPEDVEKDIANYYSNINVLEIVTALNPKPSPQEFALWTQTNIAPKSVRDVLEDKFKNEYEALFNATFAGYETDATLKNIKQNALNNIKIPDQLKGSALNYDTLNTQEICNSIVNGSLPFLRFDPESGYQTRLNYYLENTKDFEKNFLLYFRKLNRTVDANQDALLFLANSNLPEDVANKIIVKTIGDVRFTLHDIKGLGSEEFAALIRYDNKKDLLDWCADHTYFTFNLLGLVVYKLVTSIAEEVKVKYGHYRITILHIAADNGNTAAIAEMLKHEEGRATLSEKNNDGFTPLVSAARNGYTAAIAEILKHKEGRATLSEKDNNGQTPLHHAAENGGTEAIAEMLKHAEGKAALSIKDKYGHTPLKLAVLWGCTEALVEILKHKEGIASLSIQDNKGLTPLHCAAERWHAAAVAEILKYKEGLATLSEKDNDGYTPLHWALVRNKQDVIKILLDNGACPTLTALLSNTFSPEINQQMRGNYRSYLSSTAHQAMNTGWQTLEFVSNAMAGPALNRYMNEHGKREAEEQGGTAKRQK